MRGYSWILLLAILLGSLLVDPGVPANSPARAAHRDSAPAPVFASGQTRSRPSSAPGLYPAAATASRHEAADAFDGAAVSDASGSRADAAAGPALEDTTSSPIDLDRAPADQVVGALQTAIDRERLHRPLFVSRGLIGTVAHERRVRVIFETGPGRAPAGVETLLAGASGAAAFEALRLFPMLERGAATVGPQALANLIGNPETHHIELDAVHRPSLLDTIPLIHADLAHQQGYDGDGVAVALIDTGVDPTQPMLAGRIVEEACFSALSDCPNGLTQMLGPGAAVPCALSGCGHGTEVAGIAVGDDPDGVLIGVAPHADLIAIQVFSDINGEPGAYSSDILAGFQHVLGLAPFYDIASVNLSLGGDSYTAEAACDEASSSHYAAIALLRSVGVITVAAAGNASFTNALTTPACLSNVIGVGSTSKTDIVSSFSNSASFLRMLAPGESVETARNGGGSEFASGTSMATPHVAGALAVIREAVPDASPTEIENALALSGKPILDTRNGVTTPRIRVQDAINLLQATTSPPVDPEDPEDPGDPGSASGGSGTPSPARTSSSGGGGACGLVGIEPFLVLGLVRVFGRRSRTGCRKAT